jgi:hypothetical protein
MSDNAVPLHPQPPALPTTSAGLLAQRQRVRKRTLNQDVEAVHLRLWDEEPDYQLLFRSIYKEEAIEGSFLSEDFLASQKIQLYARQHGFEIAGAANLTAIRKSLNHVRLLLQQGRKQRRKLAEQGGVVSLAAQV